MWKAAERNPGENGKDYAYRVIRQNIMDLTLAPGLAVSEIDLAAALQLSRTPVREVMSRLKEEYLVEVIPQVGTYISKIHAQLIEEAAFMRFTLEKEVLLLACESFPLNLLSDMQRNVEMQQKKVEKLSAGAAAFHYLDNEFHRLLFRGCGKEQVWNAVTRLSTHYNRMRLLFETEHPAEAAIRQHIEWMALIAGGQREAVESAVYSHILEPILHWKTLLGDERYKSYFKSSHGFEISSSSNGVFTRNED
ncbi:GntR family transcriptional regulator [Saccharibacillus deserti]|uniref:GntR family transcriptional regulator n=1 Tax=Saccharibacillus deserti TaxID=1634444 RepID=UPI001555F62F|nr:GntR family transcriptional regulator [Saccharibacillus deserti]